MKVTMITPCELQRAWQQLLLVSVPAIGVQASTNLCRCQARVNGEAAQKIQPNIPLKRDFYLLLFSFSYFC